MNRHWLLRLWYSFSAGGLLVGTLFFAASLTPSLIPRTYLTQGVLSGCALAAGYGVGVFWRDGVMFARILLRFATAGKRIAKVAGRTSTRTGKLLGA